MSSTDPGKRLTDWVFRKTSRPSAWGENLFHEMHSPSWEESCCYTSKGQRDGSSVSNGFQDFDLWVPRPTYSCRIDLHRQSGIRFGFQITRLLRRVPVKCYLFFSCD
jgi:hypothetical protein